MAGHVQFIVLSYYFGGHLVFLLHLRFHMYYYNYINILLLLITTGKVCTSPPITIIKNLYMYNL